MINIIKNEKKEQELPESIPFFFTTNTNETIDNIKENYPNMKIVDVDIVIK